MIWIIVTWVAPEYPSRIDGDSLVGSPKSLQEFSSNRKTYPSSLISSIMKKNLFRKQRTEFRVALASPPPENVGSALPPPEIIVRGIMLLSNLRRAVLEGSYFVQGANGKPESKTIKKKSYELHDFLGDYQIIAVDKKSITLKGPRGKNLTKQLNRKSLTPIAREANLLYYKKKKKDVKKPVSDKPLKQENTTETEPTPPPQQEANQLQSPVPEKPTPTSAHVSGIRQKQVSNISVNISGLRTQTQAPRKVHISGR